MRFQIAQKLHAVSDPHEPPNAINDRARDVIDLILLRDLAATTGSPTLTEVRAAATAVFAARANEAAQLRLPIRVWPPTVFGYPQWADDFTRAAASGGVGLLLQEAVADVNAWIKQIEVAGLQDEEVASAKKAKGARDPAAP